MNLTDDEMIASVREAFADGSLTMSRIDDHSGVLVHVPLEMLVNLNASACVIVDHVRTDPSATVATCAQRLVESFHVGPEVAIDDCRHFLDGLARKMSGPRRV